jgi:hypothetical protein
MMGGNMKRISTTLAAILAVASSMDTYGIKMTLEENHERGAPVMQTVFGPREEAVGWDIYDVEPLNLSSDSGGDDSVLWATMALAAASLDGFNPLETQTGRRPEAAYPPRMFPTATATTANYADVRTNLMAAVIADLMAGGGGYELENIRERNAGNWLQSAVAWVGRNLCCCCVE